MSKYDTDSNFQVQKESFWTDPAMQEDGGSDFCIKSTKEMRECADPLVRKDPACTDICMAGFGACEQERKESFSCNKLRLDKEDWLRKVNFLNLSPQKTLKNRDKEFSLP